MKPGNKDLKARIKSIKKELETDKDDKSLKERLASLTNGMVTIKVGAHTQIQLNERIFRYEDAINATRAAMRDGYLVGGGLALQKAYNPKQHPVEYQAAFKKFCEANIRQIAENCGKHVESILKGTEACQNQGFNALTDTIENLLDAGVIDPLKVTEMAVNNAVSIVGEIICSNYLIVNELENEK